MASSIRSSFWCHRCNQLNFLPTQDSILCPDCGAGFIEEFRTAPPHHRFMPAPNTHCRAGGNRSPFNPVIILCGTTTNLASGIFELYQDDDAESGLRPLSASISEILMGSGFDRLLDQLTQVEINGIGQFTILQPLKQP